MAATQEHLVTCGTGKIPAWLPVDRTRIIPPPPLSVPARSDPAAAFRQALEHPAGMPPLRENVGKGALGEAEAWLGRQCTISYHPHPSARNYYTRVHVNGGTGDGNGARR